MKKLYIVVSGTREDRTYSLPFLDEGKAKDYVDKVNAYYDNVPSDEAFEHIVEMEIADNYTWCKVYSCRLNRDGSIESEWNDDLFISPEQASSDPAPYRMGGAGVGADSFHSAGRARELAYEMLEKTRELMKI